MAGSSGSRAKTLMLSALLDSESLSLVLLDEYSVKWLKHPGTSVRR